MTKKELLMHVKELINTPDKWCKGKFGMKDPETHQRKYCLLGALRVAARAVRVIDTAGDFLRFAPTPEYWDIYNLLGDLGGMDFGLAFFNDAPTTTHQDVIDLLDKAIETIPND